MDIWKKLYERAEKEYHPEDISPFIQAHHVVCALESEDGTIYTGFCIEACSGVMNLCAERRRSEHVCKQRSDSDKKADRFSGQSTVWRRKRNALRCVS